MSWLIDNANKFHILFAVVGVGCLAIWRFNSRVKYLAYAVGALAAMVFLWILSVNIKTDRQQLEDNVTEMARAVEKKQLEGLFKHISNDFRYKGITREMLYDVAQKQIKAHDVKNIRINRFNAEIDRAKKFARTGFIVTATADREIVFRAEADFVLEKDDWKLKTLRFYPIGQDQEFDIGGQ
jgi:hypothetical protein